MRELSFSEKFALISLNGKEKAKINSDKKVVLKCIAAASIVELYLYDSFVFDDGILSVTEDDIKQQSISKYQKVVLDGILKKRKIINDKFIICINEVVSLRCKTLKNIESLYISTFYNINCIEEKSILLNDYTSKKDKEDLFKYYNTKEEFYLSLINELRYGVLYVNDISEENIFMIWLLRESGLLNNIFTNDELIILERKMANINYKNTLSNKILKISIKKDIKNKIKKVMKNNNSFLI